MAKKVGTYYFARLRSNWGIWIVISNDNGYMMGDFVKSVSNYEDAVRETYSLNGWKQPERIIKKY